MQTREEDDDGKHYCVHVHTDIHIYIYIYTFIYIFTSTDYMNVLHIFFCAALQQRFLVAQLCAHRSHAFERRSLSAFVMRWYTSCAHLCG